MLAVNRSIRFPQELFDLLQAQKQFPILLWGTAENFFLFDELGNFYTKGEEIARGMYKTVFRAHKLTLLDFENRIYEIDEDKENVIQVIKKPDSKSAEELHKEIKAEFRLAAEQTTMPTPIIYTSLEGDYCVVLTENLGISLKSEAGRSLLRSMELPELIRICLSICQQLQHFQLDDCVGARLPTNQHLGPTKQKSIICHRDIKPDNILLSQETGAVTIIDFGFTKDRPSTGSFIYDPKMKGTPYFLAPEALTFYTSADADIYALAGTLGALFSAKNANPHYYRHLKDEAAAKARECGASQVHAAIQAPYDFSQISVTFEARGITVNFSVFVQQFLSKMQAEDPEKRLNIEEVCKFFGALGGAVNAHQNGDIAEYNRQLDVLIRLSIVQFLQSNRGKRLVAVVSAAAPPPPSPAAPVPAGPSSVAAASCESSIERLTLSD